LTLPLRGTFVREGRRQALKTVETFGDEHILLPPATPH
jgi:hypothetical protein